MHISRRDTAKLVVGMLVSLVPLVAGRNADAGAGLIELLNPTVCRAAVEDTAKARVEKIQKAVEDVTGEKLSEQERKAFADRYVKRRFDLVGKFYSFTD